jgi:hypothetical protein
MDWVSWPRAIKLMTMRQKPRIPARIAVNFARSLCRRAPRSAFELPAPPKALVRPVSFESWIKMTAVMRSVDTNTTTERSPQTTPPTETASKFPWIMHSSRCGRLARRRAWSRPGRF